LKKRILNWKLHTQKSFFNEINIPLFFNKFSYSIVMRKLTRSIPLQIRGRNTQSTYDPETNNQRLKNWTSRLSNLAASQTSKVYLSQLGALVNYYNRAAIDNTKVKSLIFRILIGMTGKTELPLMDLLKKCKTTTLSKPLRSMILIK